MNLNNLILTTLTPIGVPVAFQQYTGSAPAYITFFEFSQTGAIHGDDKELKSRHSIQVDVWSRSNYTEIVKQVKERLIAIGFTRSMETEFYEKETDTYHKVIRFNFVQ